MTKSIFNDFYKSKETKLTYKETKLFEDKDLEYISPFLYSTSMDFSVDDTGTTIVLSDPNTGTALINYPVNTIKAIDEDVGIRVVLDDGDKIYINQLILKSSNGIMNLSQLLN